METTDVQVPPRQISLMAYRAPTIDLNKGRWFRRRLMLHRRLDIIPGKSIWCPGKYESIEHLISDIGGGRIVVDELIVLISEDVECLVRSVRRVAGRITGGSGPLD